MIKRAFASLITWIVVFQLVSITIGYVTRFGMYPWYGQLIKSSFTPPGYYFGIIWPILYINLGLCFFTPEESLKSISFTKEDYLAYLMAQQQVNEDSSDYSDGDDVEISGLSSLNLDDNSQYIVI